MWGYIEFESGNPDRYISMDLWGKDHWSTFAYFETRVVDYRGKIHNEHMRCNARLHRIFAHRGSGVAGKEYPTRLKHNVEYQDRHDDWSCAEDMVAMGLIHLHYKEPKVPGMGGGEAVVELTELGKDIGSQLRQWKSGGNNFAQFVPSLPADYSPTG